MFLADLKVLSGKHQGKVITLTSKKFLIGRGDDCQMRPNNDLVSRHHCIFTCDDYSVRLRDLASTNGTFVNGEKIRGQVELNTGDQIRIGKLEFEATVREEEKATVAETEQETAAIAAVELPDESAVVVNSDQIVQGQQEAEAATGSETMYEMPTTLQPPVDAAETGVISASETAFIPADQFPQQPPVPQIPQMPAQQPPPLQYAPGAVPPGYAYPPGYAPPQGYQPPMMPPGVMPPGQQYPQQPMPGYPAYPPMQQPPMQQPPMQQPMVPNQQMGYPPQPVPPEGVAPEQITPLESETEAAASGSTSTELPLQLPNPSETGAVEEVKKESKDESAPSAPVETPSTKANDIIKQIMHRRPG